MKDQKVESFLKVANKRIIREETGLSYPTLQKWSDGGYSVARGSNKAKLIAFIERVDKGKY